MRRAAISALNDSLANTRARLNEYLFEKAFGRGLQPANAEQIAARLACKVEGEKYEKNDCALIMTRDRYRMSLLNVTAKFPRITATVVCE